MPGKSYFNSPRNWVLLGLAFLVIVVLYKGLTPKNFDSPFDLAGLAEIPVQEGGRVKPLDTVARVSLMMISGKQTYRDTEDNRLEAMEWFTELILDPQASAHSRVFRIDHPEIVGHLGFHNEERKYFSLAEIAPHFQVLQEQFARIPRESGLRNPYEQALFKLQNALTLYDRVAYVVVPPPFFGNAENTYEMVQRVVGDSRNTEADAETQSTAANALELFRNQFRQLAATAHVQIVPPPVTTDADWQSLGTALIETTATGELDPVLKAWADLSLHYQNKDAFGFNDALKTLAGLYEERGGAQTRTTGFEYFFNAFAPFMVAMQLYVLIFIVAAFSWMVWPQTLSRAAFWLLMLAFAIHTFGMFARIYIQGRPPVTNLYSSAIFVSWAAIPLCLYLEHRSRNCIAAAAAALMGFVTLIIAYHLSFSGDTMEMMRAVLDSNFWLATHVPTVTLGYSATFLAGLIAAIHIVRSALLGGVEPRIERMASGMVYGAACFALLFSFVGTVLGGIWADQSWGRFWGWDPKENGALMIVLWNAVLLHARWAKTTSPIGLMQLAVIGNIITAWSWFGTNMLGVGLHSYGFMDAAFLWLMAFILSQVGVIFLGYYCRRIR